MLFVSVRSKNRSSLASIFFDEREEYLLVWRRGPQNLVLCVTWFIAICAFHSLILLRLKP